LNNYAIEIRDLSLKIGNRSLLNHIKFNIHQGEWVTLIGKNGSGKTTLLKSILKLNEVEGEVKILDQWIELFTVESLSKKISYVPQVPPSGLQMKVSEFLQLARYPYRDDLNERINDQKIISEMIEALSITDLYHRNFSTLSGGEQQKVLLASALVQQTPILLLDEPGAALDPAFRTILLHQLKKVCQKKSVTVIEVSHDINTTKQVADRVIALKDGRLIYDLACRDLFNPKILEKIYDQPFLILHDKDLDLKAAIAVEKKR
jgi:iron complex transport system ATP-binding protein